MQLFSNRNERTGLLIAAVLFAIIGAVQLWRGFTNTAVVIGGHNVPVWLSLIAALVALGMAFWMGVILRSKRPIL